MTECPYSRQLSVVTETSIFIGTPSLGQFQPSLKSSSPTNEMDTVPCQTSNWNSKKSLGQSSMAKVEQYFYQDNNSRWLPTKVHERIFFCLDFPPLNIHNSHGNRGSRRLILTPLYKPWPLHKHWEVIQAITTDVSSLHIGSDRTQSG